MSMSFIVKGDGKEKSRVQLFMTVSPGESSEILRSIVLFDDDLDESENF